MVCLTGGGAGDDFWMQLIADVLRRRVVRGGGDGLFGAARLAAEASGAVGVVAPVVAEEREFNPDRGRAGMLEARYEAWRMAC